MTSILLVDDNDAQRRMIRAHLEHAGFAVTSASNGRQALELAQGSPPDLVVSDVVMDELDGFGLCRRMREVPALESVPIVLLSAHYTSPLDRELAKSVGASELIERTADFEAELAWIQSAVIAETANRCVKSTEVYEQQLDANARVTTKLLAQTRDSERRLRALLDHATDTISMCTLDGELLEANARWETVLGIAPERLIGRRISQLAATADARLALENLPALVASESQLCVVALRHAVTGDTVHMELHAKVIELDGRQVVLSIGRDITDRIRAAERAAELEAMYESLVERLPDTVWRMTPELAPVFLSRNFETLTGIPIAELMVSRAEWRQRVHPEDLPRLLRAFKACHEEMRSQEVEYRFQHRNGTWLWFHARMTPREEQGRRFVDGLTSDITPRRRLEQTVMQGQKMEAIGALTGGIAHDFNNVLSVILTNSDFLLEELAATDPRRADVDGIRCAAERAASLTHQLLAFSRRQVLELTTIDLGELVAGLGKMLGRMIGEDIKLVLHRVDALGAVRADVGQLEQIVMNLVVNARDAMPSGGAVEIATSNDTVSSIDSISDVVPPGRYVVLEVTDSGCGMDAETRSRVFEPFFTTKEPGRGTGLGLSTVYGIVRQLGGYIALHSELGKGTVFRVFLPRTDDQIDAPVRRIAPSQGGTESVLLVEDDDRVRKAVQRILASRGYRVHAAANANHAIEIAAHTSIDLVLSDVVMPGMSGPDVVARIREVVPDVRVLLMSGYTEHPQLHVGEVAGGRGFIQKPFTSASLTRRVRELLDAEVP